MERIQTEDGSWTYAHPGHGATYRSLGGARTESEHVFVEPSGMGLAKRGAPWRVLELGFGTGLNFAITLERAHSLGLELHYTSVDCEPLDPGLWLLDPSWRLGPGRHCHQGVQFELVTSRWQQWPTSAAEFDVYYHDPFGPRVSPDCWGVACFEWARTALKPGARLLTYGASTASRRAMKDAGFEVAVRRGAGRKREMTVASAERSALEGLKLWKR